MADGPPTYHVGQTVRAGFRFDAKRGVEGVTATFVLLTDPETTFILSGTPTEETPTSEGYSYYTVVLEGNVTLDDTYGFYSCEALEADYPGGRKVPFQRPINVRFRIPEENIRPPTGIDDTWKWGPGDESEAWELW